jgi:hypothetical protein
MSCHGEHEAHKGIPRAGSFSDQCAHFAVAAATATNGRLGRIDRALFTLGLIAYTAWAILKSGKEQAAVVNEDEFEFGSEPAKSNAGRTLLNVVFVLAGLRLLVLGSRWFVDSAITLARNLGVSELVIGLTIVAAATSLPEVATSIMAARHGGLWNSFQEHWRAWRAESSIRRHSVRWSSHVISEERSSAATPLPPDSTDRSRCSQPETPQRCPLAQTSPRNRTRRTLAARISFRCFCWSFPASSTARWRFGAST